MKPNKQLAGLDIIRFVAALLVMFHHLGFWMWSGSYRTFHDGGSDVTYHWLAPFTWFGWIGVEIFFVLSGFVIAYSADGATAGDFARGRFIRLYPTAWICSTVTLIAVLAGGPSLHDTFGAWLRAFLLSPKGPWIDGSYWTLAVELGFYLVIFALLKAGVFHRVGTVMTVIGLISSTAAAGYVLLSHGVASTFGTRLMSRYDGDWKIAFLLLRHGSFFAIGTLLWLVLFRAASPRRILAIAVCILGGLLEIVLHAAEINLFSGFQFSFVVPAALWLLTLAGIVYSVKRKGTINRALGTRGATVARSLGLMTYPLYLLHQRAGYALIAGGRGHVPDLVSLVLVMLLFLGLAYFISMYPDKMLQRRLRTVLHGVPKQSAAPASLP